MRISDWSSDVCSSDLPSLDGTLRRNTDLTARIEHDFTPDISNRLVLGWTTGRQKYEEILGVLGWEEDPAASDADNRRRLSRALLITSSHAAIGRAACRERVFQSV